MFTYILYTKDEQKIDEIYSFIHAEYSEFPVETKDINWNNHSEEWASITAFTLKSDIDAYLILKTFNVSIRKLKGNNFIDIIEVSMSISDYVDIVTSVLQDKSKEYGYDNIISACSYKDSTVEKYRTESTAFIKWRDHLWSISLEEAQINLNDNPIDLEEFQSNLPTYESFLNQ